mgnify:CR=1 FL=1
MVLADYYKTILRYFLRMFIVTLISYPFSIAIGLFNQIHPYMQSVGEFIFYYTFCIIFSYNRKSKKMNKIQYKENLVSEKVSFFAEIIKTIRDEKRTLIIDTLAFWSLYSLSQATLLRGTIFGLYNENETMTLIVHIIIMLTFPIFDMFIMFFIRRKWYKEFILHKKSAKVQEFRE